MREISPYIIRAEQVSKIVKHYEEDIQILHDVNLNIKAGDTVAIIGASGSGKTTLLTLLAGLDLPSAGEIFFNGKSLSRLDEEARAQIRAKYVGFIFQSFYLLPSLTALENVMLPLEIQGQPLLAARQTATEWLNQVGLAKRTDHYPNQLSGGEQQRVAIARAFVTNPQIIFADEMTGNLDNKTGAMIRDILFAINETKMTTLMLVTHDIQLAQRCQYQYSLHEGKCVHA